MLTAGTLPPALSEAGARLPPASFLLFNERDEAITAIVVVWSFADLEGRTTRHRLNCDGYLDAPTQEIVAPHSRSLITVFGCTREEFFSRMIKGGVVGSSLAPPNQNQGLDAFVAAEITLDSVIFADGSVVGLDAFKYHSVITDRFDAMKSILSEFLELNPQDAQGRARMLSKIKRDAQSENTEFMRSKARFASTLENSPDFQGTLTFFQSFTSPPSFFAVQ